LHEETRLKFLRPNYGHEQIDEQQQGDDGHDEVFHGVLLQFFAEANVKPADDEERHDNADEHEVNHTGSPSISSNPTAVAMRGCGELALQFGPRRRPGSCALWQSFFISSQCSCLGASRS